MPHIIVFEDDSWRCFIPLTYPRAVFQLICGATDLFTRIQRLASTAPSGTADTSVAAWCRRDLAPLLSEQLPLPINQPSSDATLFLNGRVLWNALPGTSPIDTSWVAYTPPPSGSTKTASSPTIACLYADATLAPRLSPELLQDSDAIARLLAELRLPMRELASGSMRLLNGPWDLVLAGASILAADLAALPGHALGGAAGGHAGRIDAGAYLLAPEHISLGEGSRIYPTAVLDAETGPIVISRGVRVLPHTFIQGPVFIGENSIVQPGTSIRDGCFIGPVCKAGGEIDATIIQGYSNKQHDGFLGHSYVGSWVNIAADCVTSDLKNTYGSIRVPINGVEVDTGEMFVGSVFADHSKIGINVAMPTGAVVGYSANVFTSPAPKFSPSFSWLTEERSERYDPARALAVAKKVMLRRKITMSPAEEKVFMQILDQSAKLESLL